MKVKAIIMCPTLCAAAVMFCLGVATAAGFATNPHMGTWKLNEAKSKLAANATKNHTVVYEASGDDIKVTVDGTDAAGAATHNEWTGKFDGKYYPVSGDPTSDTRAYRKINNRTITITAKKGKKVALTGTITVSANGKTRTVTTRGTDANGKLFRSTAVYDKQ